MFYSLFFYIVFALVLVFTVDSKESLIVEGNVFLTVHMTINALTLALKRVALPV